MDSESLRLASLRFYLLGDACLVSPPDGGFSSNSIEMLTEFLILSNKSDSKISGCDLNLVPFSCPCYSLLLGGRVFSPVILGSAGYKSFLARCTVCSKSFFRTYSYSSLGRRLVLNYFLPCKDCRVEWIWIIDIRDFIYPKDLYKATIASKGESIH